MVDRPDDLDDEDAACDRLPDPPGSRRPVRAELGSADAPSTTTRPPDVVPAASTKAPIASGDRGGPDDERGPLDRPARCRFGGRPGTAPRAPVSTGSSRTRHGVAFGSTHRPPRRDGRATTPGSDATSRHVGGTSDAARRLPHLTERRLSATYRTLDVVSLWTVCAVRALCSAALHAESQFGAITKPPNRGRCHLACVREVPDMPIRPDTDSGSRQAPSVRAASGGAILARSAGWWVCASALRVSVTPVAPAGRVPRAIARHVATTSRAPRRSSPRHDARPPPAPRRDPRSVRRSPRSSWWWSCPRSPWRSAAFSGRRAAVDGAMDDPSSSPTRPHCRGACIALQRRDTHRRPRSAVGREPDGHEGRSRRPTNRSAPSVTARPGQGRHARTEEDDLTGRYGDAHARPTSTPTTPLTPPPTPTPTPQPTATSGPAAHT